MLFDRTRNADSVYAIYKRFPKGERRKKRNGKNIRGAWIRPGGYQGVHIVESDGAVKILQEIYNQNNNEQFGSRVRRQAGGETSTETQYNHTLIFMGIVG